MRNQPDAAPGIAKGEGIAVVVRRVFLAALVVWGLYGLRHPGDFTLLDSVDLAVHETGHLVFGPFGEVIAVAGGTIMQLLMPAAFAVSFWRRGDQYGACVALWWVAQSCGNVATYVADARAQELPLVGGGEHDWAYLLGEAGLMSHDQQIARVIRAVAFAMMIGAGVWGVLRARADTTRTEAAEQGAGGG
ncbi:MAG: hypothetical protein JWN79_595 [Gemmatimonadetes bacterium]|nr:hypothetical protein [Gemmatimonadota bacterium]